jgi:hypothetical protein
MFTIPGHKGNANQNHTKILPHGCWNSYHQKHHLTKNVGEDVGKWNPHKLLVGMLASTTILENNMEAS